MVKTISIGERDAEFLSKAKAARTTGELRQILGNAILSLLRKEMSAKGATAVGKIATARCKSLNAKKIKDANAAIKPGPKVIQ
jgi:hypothetical protein